MKPFPRLLSVTVRTLLLSSGFWIAACGEDPRQSESAPAEAEAKAAVEPREEAEMTEEQVTELRREIESKRQNIDDLEAFVQMERAKVEDDPDYDQSFLLDALEEQREIKEDIESGEKRLQELTGHGE